MKPTQINAQNYSKFESTNYKKVSTQKNYSKCCSFAFNTNNKILFVGQDHGKIKVLGLNNHTKLIQTVFTFSRVVVCLVWRKQSNSLILGHSDRFIIWNVWNQLTPFQILEPISDTLRCMILNEDGDILVSGSFDEHLQIWKKQSQGWISSQILEIPVSADCLSFNASQNTLILCGSNKRAGKYIVVIKQQDSKNWATTQTINFKDFSLGESICFINDNKFAYQTSLTNYLEIYDYNEQNNSFFESQRVQIQKSREGFWFFASQFIKGRNVLIVCQGNSVNYFSKDTNGDFLLLKNSIKFGSSFFFGKVSDDGLYQVIWDGNSQYEIIDNGSYEIQIRKIKCLNE